MVIDYKDLIAWQRSMELAIEIYSLTRCFPADERFGLTNQVRRAAVSIASNIAEGQGRTTDAEFRHFLRIANGSRQEVETQVMIGLRLGYTTDAGCRKVLSLVDECGRLIWGLLRSIPTP